MAWSRRLTASAQAQRTVSLDIGVEASSRRAALLQTAKRLGDRDASHLVAWAKQRFREQGMRGVTLRPHMKLSSLCGAKAPPHTHDLMAVHIGAMLVLVKVRVEAIEVCQSENELL